MSLPNEVNPQLLASSASYTINQSLRLRSSASAYLNRTAGSAPTSNQKLTISFWFKPSLYRLTPEAWLFSSGTDSGRFGLYYNVNASWGLEMGSGPIYVRPSRKWRDPAAWYHIVIAVDTTQATSSDRVKWYTNGVLEDNSDSYPAQNTTINWNGNGILNYIGRFSDGRYYDGYLAEFNSVDGQQLTPSSFGQNDSQTGVWQPKKYGGTYGTNGYYLPFSNTSSTSTLGNDFSGNGNTWTVNNISLTAGTTYDWMRDSPTLGTLASNYATLNPLDKLGSSFPTTTNGNLRVTPVNSAVTSTIILPTTGKWYWEATLTTGQYPEYGLARLDSAGGGTSTGVFGVYYNGNNIWLANSSDGITDGNHAINSGDIGLVAVDVDNNKLWLGRSRSGTIVWAGGGNPATGASPTFSASGGGGVYATTFNALTWCFPLFASGGGSDVWDANFGQQAWVYTPPTGYKALNTYNLPTPTIGAKSATRANKNFDINLYTGNDTAGTNITNTGEFQPDLVWIKVRSGAGDHGVWDSIRGASRRLVPNTTATEGSVSGVTAFNSNGFTLGAAYNVGASTYVAWQWNAGGANTTNTNGSVTSIVRANPSAGFSVVNYTSPNTTSDETVGHGLNAAPQFIITKNRDRSFNWDVWHQNLSSGYDLTFESVAEGAGRWSTTTPTSSVFTVKYNYEHYSTDKYVAYCWTEIPGYSKIGYWNGNTSSDGPFVYCGFRPKFIIIKRRDGAYNWNIWDTARNPTNTGSTYWLYPNNSAAEDNNGQGTDFLSNGFKLRSTGADINGGTMLFAAFAETPFKYANAR
jgi:hypothetical protein